MKQVKIFTSDKKANKWLKENIDKEILSITCDAGNVSIIYEEVLKPSNKTKK